MTSKNTKVHLTEIGVMRAVLILSIVIGHTFAIYGITGSSSWELPNNIDNVKFFWWINPVFISFSLQAFVFISGYLLRMQTSVKVIERKTFLSKKISRLFIPMIVFGFLYWQVIDQCEFVNLYDCIVYFLSGPGHLWFLAMLFMCFVIMCFIIHYIELSIKTKGKQILLFGLLGLLYIVSLFAPSVFRLSQFCQYFIYFVLGYCVYGERTRLMETRWVMILAIGVVVTLFICFKLYLIQVRPNHFYLINHFNNFIIGVSGSFLVLLLCMKCHNGSYLSEIGAWNGFFGVYIFHQFILRILYYKTDLLVGLNKYLIGFSALVLTLFLSWGLAKVFLNYRFTRKLI